VQVGGLSTTATLQPLEVSVIGVGLDIVKVRLHLSKSEQFPNGQLQPYVTAGPAIFHSRLKDSNNVMPNNTRESDTNLGVKIGLGLQYLIGPNVGLFGEYRFTHFKAESSYQDTTLPASTEPCPRISICITSLAGSRSTFKQCWGRAELCSIAKTLMHDRLGAKQAISASIG
jgi:hypothetical protein